MKTISSLPYKDALFYSAIFLFFVLFYWVLPLFPQPEKYHHFSGDQVLFGLPNFMNVASNIFYILAGIIGLYRIRKVKLILPIWRWQLFFISIALVGLGSGYYHFSPSTHSLFWDRLPMCLGFAFLSANFLAERYLSCDGHKPLLLILAFSLYSILHWHIGEMLGVGDLRLYGVTQFATIGLIGGILSFRARCQLLDKPYWILFIGYAIAKICEEFDPIIFTMSHELLGGHVIKHIVSGIALICFVPPFIYIKTRFAYKKN